MKRTVWLGTLSAANIGISFALNWFVLTQIGPGIHTDALFAAMTVPQLLLVVITGSLARVLVPILSGETHDSLKRDAWTFLWLVTGLFSLLAIVLALTASWWVPWTVPGFTAAEAGFTAGIARVHLLGMVFSAATGVQLAACQARQQYLRTEVALLACGSIGLALLVAVLPLGGVLAAAWVNVARIGLLMALLMLAMGRPSGIDMSRYAIGKAWSRMKPLLGGTAYYKTEPLVDRLLLSSTASGTISLYLLAQQAYGAVSQIVARAISTPLLTELSGYHKNGDLVGFRRHYRRKLIEVTGISVAGILVLIAFGQPLLDALFGHGRISIGHISELWWIMLWLAGMFVGGTAGQISSSAFYAVGDTATPSMLGIWIYTIFLPLKVIAFYRYGIMGIALVTSAFAVVNFGTQLFLFERRLSGSTKVRTQ